MPDSISYLDRACNNLSRAIQFPTVSDYAQENVDFDPYLAYRDFIRSAYPLVHQKLEFSLVNNHAMVYRWAGKAPAGQYLPGLLTAHYDVVPAQAEGWPYPAYSGQIADGRIYGRGSLDDKCSMIGLLETIEALLSEQWQPERDLYFAFGFDEEVSGQHGAKQVAKYFQSQGLRFEFVLDEGGAVADGSTMGIAPAIAVVGLAEKGQANFEFSFEGSQGHSSTPPQDTSLSKLAAYISKVQANPRPKQMTETVAKMLQTIAPYMAAPAKYLAAQPKLFFPILAKALAKNPQTAAMLHTTIAFTMASCGSAPNVLPKTASAVANVRLLQGDTVDQVLAWLQSLDPEVKIRKISGENPTPAASTDSPIFHKLSQTIYATFPETIVTPYLMCGGTDSRHYVEVADNAYRFLPVRVSQAELGLMHASGEYLSLENVQNILAFYRHFILNLDLA